MVLINKIKKEFGEDLSNMSFSIWRLSFKPGTDDMRKTLSTVIIDELIKFAAKIKIHYLKAINIVKNIFNDN